jgi:uncharacterized membrane protein YkoI
VNNKVMKVVATAAVALGIAGGSYGIANAASGSGSSTTPSQSAAPRTQQPWGGQRSDETVLTGDTLAKVKAAAADSVGNGTIIRVETDADGNAAYEVHFVKSDGTPATVYVDKNFDVVSVETR